MSIPDTPVPETPSNLPNPPDPKDPNATSGGVTPVTTQNVNYSHVSARVPERLVRGIFATNALVLSGPQEVVFDFLLRLVPPPQVAARVIMPWTSLGGLVNAMQENLNSYRSRFPGAPALPPPPPNLKPPSIQEIYDQMKIGDDAAVGAYANTLMVTHSATEFCFDFILDIFPRPTVTARIYLAAPQVPPFLEALKRTLQQLQAHQQSHGQPPFPGPGPAGPPGSATPAR